MKPRITMALTADEELNISLNPAGRDLLVRELQTLNETSEHFHLAPNGRGEVEVCTRAYRPTDTIIERGKVLFRLDEWDRRDFPHVISDNN
jgi:hypothetical protein